MILLQDFIDEAITQIRNGVNAANKKSDYIQAGMPPTIDFDLGVSVCRDGIYVCGENDIPQSTLKITVDVVRYAGGKHLYGVE